MDGVLRDRADLIGLADQVTFRIHLAPEVCRRVALLLEGQAVGRGLNEAVGLFTHEIEHFRARGYEDRVECSAMQRMEAVGVALGASKTLARRLSVSYWRFVYPLKPAEYRSAGCRDGGSMDLRPENPRWP